MKKRSILLSLLLASAIILAACSSGQEEANENPAATDQFGNPLVTEAVGSPEATEAFGTPSMTESVSTPQATEALSTPEVTTAPAITPTIQTTESVTDTGTVTGTGALPSTGYVDPSRVSNELDFDVYNKSNDKIADVDDLVINLGTAHVEYVLLNYNGKTVAVPCEALKAGNAKSAGQSSSSMGQQNGYVLNIDEAELDGAPEIDKSSLPKLGEQPNDWDASIRSYWQDKVTVQSTGTMTSTDTVTGTGTTTGQSGLQGVVLASDLMDYEFKVGDQSLEVDDVIVDVNTCQVQYVVVSTGGLLQEKKLIPIPVRALSWDSTNNTFALSSIDATALMQAPTFTDDKYPNTNSPNWDREWRAFWDQYTSP